MGLIGFDWVLPGFTGFYRVLPGFIRSMRGFCTVLPLTAGGGGAGDGAGEDLSPTASRRHKERWRLFIAGGGPAADAAAASPRRCFDENGWPRWPAVKNSVKLAERVSH